MSYGSSDAISVLHHSLRLSLQLCLSSTFHSVDSVEMLPLFISNQATPPCSAGLAAFLYLYNMLRALVSLGRREDSPLPTYFQTGSFLANYAFLS